MPPSCTTSCLTLSHTLSPLHRAAPASVPHVINMESRNIFRVNSSVTHSPKAAKSIGLNWYSWRLSSQESALPAGRSEDRRRRCSGAALIMCAEQHRRPKSTKKSKPLNYSSSSSKVKAVSSFFLIQPIDEERSILNMRGFNE